MTPYICMSIVIITIQAYYSQRRGRMAEESLRYHSRLAELTSVKKTRELRHNNFMGQGKSFLCNFAERASMPKGIENPEKEELRCQG